MIRSFRPNAPKRHNPDPAYINSLVLFIGWPLGKVAERVGIDVATLRRYRAKGTKRYAPYCVQFTLECLAAAKEHDADMYVLKQRQAAGVQGPGRKVSKVLTGPVSRG